MRSSLVPHKMCLNKVPYKSKKEAEKELNYWKNFAHDLIPSYVMVYKCSICFKWHLGKSTRK